MRKGTNGFKGKQIMPDQIGPLEEQSELGLFCLRMFMLSQ